jgi:hypothetical protein
MVLLTYSWDSLGELNFIYDIVVSFLLMLNVISVPPVYLTYVNSVL